MQQNGERMEINADNAEQAVLRILKGFVAGAEVLMDRIARQDPELDMIIDPTCNGVSDQLDLLGLAFAFLEPGGLSESVLAALDDWLQHEHQLVGMLTRRYGRCRQFHDTHAGEAALVHLVCMPWRESAASYVDKLRERVQTVKRAYHANAIRLVEADTARPADPAATAAVTRELAAVSRNVQRVAHALTDTEEHCWDKLGDARRQQVLEVWRRAQALKAEGRPVNLYAICCRLYGSFRMHLQVPPPGVSVAAARRAYGYPNASALYAFCKAHSLEF